MWLSELLILKHNWWRDKWWMIKTMVFFLNKSTSESIEHFTYAHFRVIFSFSWRFSVDPLSSSAISHSTDQKRTSLWLFKRAPLFKVFDSRTVQYEVCVCTHTHFLTRFSWENFPFSRSPFIPPIKAVLLFSLVKKQKLRALVHLSKVVFPYFSPTYYRLYFFYFRPELNKVLINLQRRWIFVRISDRLIYFPSFFGLGHIVPHMGRADKGEIKPVGKNVV